MRKHAKFTHVINEIEVMCERPRVNVKAERGSTFTFTRDLPYIRDLKRRKRPGCQNGNRKSIFSLFKRSDPTNSYNGGSSLPLFYFTRVKYTRVRT